MYSFLDRIELGELRSLLTRELGGEWGTRLPKADRESLYRLLFAKHGYQLLYERRARRLLLASLSQGVLNELCIEFDRPTSGKSYDMAVRLAGIPWRPNGRFTLRFAEVLGVGAQYLPSTDESRGAVETVEPVQCLPELFDYQESLVRRLLEVMEAPDSHACLLQLPTGAGKTRTAFEAVALWQSGQMLQGEPSGVIWLAHTEELCDQAAESFRRIWEWRGQDEVRLARFWGDFRVADQELVGATVVAGYQKLIGWSLAAPDAFESVCRQLGAIVVDEAHRAVAPTLRELLGRVSFSSGATLIGLTATPGRGEDRILENQELVSVFEGRLLTAPELGADPVRELQRRGVLAKLKYRSIESGVKLTLARGGQEPDEGSVSQTVLRALAESESRNGLILELVVEEVAAARPTILFACTVEHAQTLALRLALRDIRAAFVDHTMRRAQRRRIVEAFKRGDLDVLCNYGVLSVGFDAPNIRSVIITRPTSSAVLYSQMVGRGLRGSALGGTFDCRVIDVRDNLESFRGVEDLYRHFKEYW